MPETREAISCASFSQAHAWRQTNVGQEEGGKSKASHLLFVRCVLSHLSGEAGDKWEATGESCKGGEEEEGGREWQEGWYREVVEGEEEE